MSTYNGRRGPNVSQFLRELTIPAQEQSAEDTFNFEDDLALFTNTQFFDFDSGQNMDYQKGPIKPEPAEAPSRSDDPTSAESTINDFTGLEFMSSTFCTLSSFRSYTLHLFSLTCAAVDIILSGACKRQTWGKCLLDGALGLKGNSTQPPREIHHA